MITILSFCYILSECLFQTVITQAYEVKIQKIRDNEKILKEDLFKTTNQLQNYRLETELKHAEKLKLSALEMSQKYEILRNELEVQSQEKLETNKLLYSKEIEQLKQHVNKLVIELKASIYLFLHTN